MTRLLTIIAVAVSVCGCSSMQQDIAPAERHQAGKTKYYEALNQRQVSASAEVDGKSERAPAELVVLLDEEGL